MITFPTNICVYVRFRPGDQLATRLCVLGTGGKPSTWLPPGSLVEYLFSLGTLPMIIWNHSKSFVKISKFHNFSPSTCDLFSGLPLSHAHRQTSQIYQSIRNDYVEGRKIPDLNSNGQILSYLQKQTDTKFSVEKVQYNLLDLY